MAQYGDFTYTQGQYDPWDCTITGYTGAGGAVTIPPTITTYGGTSNVTAIGSHAFDSSEGHLITSVIITDNLTSIGWGAFQDCNLLTTVTIGSGVTSIGNYAFFSCTKLDSIYIPDSVIYIGFGAFYNCTAIESVIIGTGVTSIGWQAFYNCTSLLSITFNGLVAPIVDSTSWISYTPSGLSGHAKVASNFPPTGSYFYELKMGDQIDGVPTAPTNLTVTAGDARYIMRWEAPISTGGGEILGYNVYNGVSPSSLILSETLADNILTFTELGLVNGVTYFCSVQAYNTYGNGNLAGVLAITPSATPIISSDIQTWAISEIDNPVLSSGSGITVDYFFVSAESGRSTIIPYREIGVSSDTVVPLHPISVYGNTGTEATFVRNIYNGYPLHKVAWRLLQQIGWCRKPFYDAQNPYSDEYTLTDPNNMEIVDDSDFTTTKYDSYDTTGLHVDFHDVSITNNVVQRGVPFFNSFNSEKQSFAYNIKTISDSMGLYLYSSAKPNVENHIPIWNSSIYNQPNTKLFSFNGCTRSEYGTIITITLGIPDGSSISYSTDPLSDITIKSLTSTVYQLLLDMVDTYQDYYIIERYGNNIYVEYKNDVGGISMVATYTGDGDECLYITEKTHAAYTNTDDIERERVYYLRKWGIFAGFNPYVSMSENPANMLLEETPTVNLTYGGTDNRSDTELNNAIVAKPTWASDTKDMINRVMVKFASSSDSEQDSNIAVFPSDTPSPKYFIIKTNGYATINSGSAILSISLGSDIYIETGSITRTIFKNDTTADILSGFNNNMLYIDGLDMYFIIYVTGDTLYATPYKYNTSSEVSLIEEYMLDASQIQLTFGQDASLKVLSKELVASEPPTFALARDSQAKYGVKELSIALPETSSINDAMGYVSKLLQKHMNPKDRCICEVTQTDGWTLPLFTYVNLKDYVNYDVEMLDVDWYTDVTFYETISETTQITPVIYLSSGSVIPLPYGLDTNIFFTVYSDETPTVTATRFAEAVATYGTEVTTIYGTEFVSYYNTIIDEYVNMVTVHILKNEGDGGTPRDLKIFSNIGELPYTSETIITDTFKQTKYKDKNMLLMRVENDSTKGTYLATFGQPSEDIANIVNQINTWVGDVEKSSVGSTSQKYEDFTNVIIREWLLVRSTSGGVVSLNNGNVDATGTINSDVGVYGKEYLKTIGTFSADGNILCRLSGTPIDINSGSIIFNTPISNRDGVVMVMSDNNSIYVIGSEINDIVISMFTGTWTDKYTINGSAKCIDACASGNYIFISYIMNSAGIIYVGAFNLTDGTYTLLEEFNVSNAVKTRIVVSQPNDDYEVSIVYENEDSISSRHLITSFFQKYDKNTLDNVLSDPIYTSLGVDIIDYNKISYDIEHGHTSIKPSEDEHYLILILSYLDNVTNTKYITAFRKPYRDNSAFYYNRLSHIFLTPTSSSGFDYIKTEKRRKAVSGGYCDEIYVCGVTATSNNATLGSIYLSSSPCNNFTWSGLNLSSINGNLSPDKVYLPSDFNIIGNNGYIIISQNDYSDNNIIKIFKIALSDYTPTANISTNDISEIYSRTQTEIDSVAIYPRVLGLDSSNAIGTFYDGTRVVSTTFDVTEDMNSIIGSNVSLQNYDINRDYVTERISSYVPNKYGMIYITYAGLYNISWQIKRNIDLDPAQSSLMHYIVGAEPKAISADYGIGYLKGNHSAIKLAAGDALYMTVSSGDKSQWNNLEESYIEIYMCNKSD